MCFTPLPTQRIVNFLADEGVDKLIVEILRQEGYSVLYIAEMQPGISDDIVLDIANQQGALLLTTDKDFGELVFRLSRLAKGVVLMRLVGLSSQKKAEIVVSAIKQHLAELTAAFTVIAPSSIRIRRQRN